MKLNTQLIEQVKNSTHLIEMPDHPTNEDVYLLNEITNIIKPSANFKYYGINRVGFDHNTTHIPTIPLSSFLTQDKQMVSVEEVLAWIDIQSNVYKAIPIDELKQFLTDKTK